MSYPSSTPENPSPQGLQITEPNDSVILQRGGEELILAKAVDRFTLQPATSDANTLPQLREQIQPHSIRPVALGQLQEWVVSPSELESAIQAARQSSEVAFASHVYRMQVSDQTWVYLTEQITVQFAPQVSFAVVQSIAAELGLLQTASVEGIPRTFVFEATKAAIANPIKLANQLMRRPEVLAAEPNVVLQSQQTYRPADHLYATQWHLHHTGGFNLNANSHIGAEKAWDITRGSRSVVIAVADDGFDLNHPDFQGKGKLVAPQDLKRRDGLPMPNRDTDNHGTAVAGLAIAEETRSGVVGVAPGCAFMPIQTTGFLDDVSIEQLFKWAVDHGASVISCSWAAASVYAPLTIRQRSAISRAATQGRDGKGCVILFAAGNANRPLKGFIQEKGWPNNVLKGNKNWLSGFAVHPDVITVSASTSLNRKAAYSNWGQDVSVAAPSNNGPPVMSLPNLGRLVNTGPEISPQQPGRGLVTSDRTGRAGYTPEDYVHGFGGTSSACPVVAGVAGLMLSANPDLTAREVKQILQETADKIIDPNPDPQLRLRLGTYDNRGHSQWFGYGKVNAFKAVQAAQRRRKSRRLTRTIRGQSSRSVSIPDNDPNGVVSVIRITQRGFIQDIQIRVDVEHSFLGDITLTLLAPSGEQILLQGRTLGRATHLRETYTLNSTYNLSRLLNQSVSGQWRLKAVDLAPANTGKLNSWELVIGV
ncbi:MAG: S8 family serine peptidase [Leptolyngbyaceae cyanobacterium MO_188.B28]|nr:S8 family serine peptidase [Leptolyngbyaceae cyanobacterium MO_188.B28]